MNKLNKIGPKITCRSEKETFFPEIRQQWEKHRLDTSAKNFAQDWNLLCYSQAPNDANLRIDDLNQADSDLDDIEDFVETDPNPDGYMSEKPKPGPCQRNKESKSDYADTNYKHEPIPKRQRGRSGSLPNTS